jgi:energy-converting hydrogenase Eha subunit A
LTNSKFVSSLAIGLLLAAITVFGGFVVLGMGHGPDAPLRFSWLTFALYPLAVIRLRASAQTYRWEWDLLASLAGLLLVIFGSSAIPEPLAPKIWYIYVFGLWPIIVAVAIYAVIQYFASRSGKHLLVGDVALILIALGLDFAFWQAFLDDMSGPGMNALFFIWLLAWLGWQVMAVIALYRHMTYPHTAVNSI